MTTITPDNGPILALRVQGLAYESVSLLTGEVRACGFDRLTLQYSPENIRGDIAFDSFDQLTELAPAAQLAPILRALDWQADQDAKADTVARAENRRWLAARR